MLDRCGSKNIRIRCCYVQEEEQIGVLGGSKGVQAKSMSPRHVQDEANGWERLALLVASKSPNRHFNPSRGRKNRTHSVCFGAFGAPLEGEFVLYSGSHHHLSPIIPQGGTYGCQEERAQYSPT